MIATQLRLSERQDASLKMQYRSKFSVVVSHLALPLPMALLLRTHVRHRPRSDIHSPPSILTSIQLRRHCSFVVSYRVELLMQHLLMIDRELSISISFDELLTSHAIGAAGECDVLHWSNLLCERARLKAEGRVG